jgi:hypothetical protein
MRGFCRWRVLSVLLSLSSVPVYCQQSAVVRIGVANLRTSARDVSVSKARDRMVKKLNQRKNTANKPVKVRAVALDAWQVSEVLGEAEQKNCQFVLISHLTDLMTQEKTASFDSRTMDNREVMITAKVEYEIYGVESRKQYAAAQESGQDSTSRQEAVWRAMDVIAHDVLADLARGTMPAAAEAMAEAPSELLINPHVTWAGQDECGWLPGTLAHREVLHTACEFALSLQQKMPNFICDQETSRYMGGDRVPRDSISALLKYEDGKESFSEIKVNGRPVGENDVHSAGLWSTGEFGGDLRAIFDSENKAVFEYSGENEIGQHAAWVFHYRIAKQSDPLWVLRARDGILAPPYSGEVWLDQASGEVLRFRSVAENIPLSFAMRAAEVTINYAGENFADGKQFILPTDATIATAYRGEDPTRNLVQFLGCHKFGAKVRMVIDAPAGAKH